MTTSCLPLDLPLDLVLSQEPTVAIKHHSNNGPQFYIISGPSLTYRFVLDDLTRQGMNFNLNSIYFKQTTEVQFDLNSI